MRGSGASEPAGVPDGAHLISLAFQKTVGGGRRTRTFEVIRRLIYSQLPLPLGTLPRLNPIASFSTGTAAIRLLMTLKPVADGGRPVGRVYGGNALGKSTN